jgi:hypothetical protein
MTCRITGGWWRWCGRRAGENQPDGLLAQDREHGHRQACGFGAAGELDYDFWLGPAPRRPYNSNRSHFNYRYLWNYSGGYLIDFWCHHTDVAYWALDLKAPQSVSATGGRWAVDDNGETPDTMEVLCEYPNLFLTWTLPARRW